jgi:nucleotide-binding universal stress UspA family protein
MALKTVLACLMNRENADAVMSCAVPLARADGAHLVGLHTIEALLVYPGIAMHLPDASFASFNESQREESAAIQAVFRKHTSNEDFPSEWRLVRAESTTAAEHIIESAHAADLVVMPKEIHNVTRGDQLHAQVRVIRESGRPVIIVPQEFSGPAVGDNIVLGWSNTREAARAAHDLIKIAHEGSAISIARVDGGGDELADYDTVDLASMFDRHGLRAKTVQLQRGSDEIASVLLKHAFELGADLVATGAFGHSRAYEFAFGAVTYKLLRHAEIPVLFSA